MRTLVIINPAAGKRRGGLAAPARVALARGVLSSRGIPADVRLTEHAGHAEALARAAAAAGCDTVWAWGGDGTVNEVARALAGTGTALAIIPAGSGNGFARALGVPFDPPAALAHGLGHPARRIDTGRLDDRFFLNVAGVGLDADVAHRFNQPGNTRRGALRYVWIVCRTGLGYRALSCAVTADGDQRRESALLVALANSPQYGNGAIVAPSAVPDDGALDLVVVRDRPVAARLLDSRRLFTGRLDGARGVFTRRVREVVIEADAPLLFHVDGEPVQGGTRLVGRIDPGSLHLRA